MLCKTTDSCFQKYGEPLLDLPEDASSFSHEPLMLDNKSVSTAFFNGEEIYIHVESGIALLCVSEKNQSDNYEQFILQHTIKLNKNLYFNFLSVSDTAVLTVSKPASCNLFASKIEGNALHYQRITPTIQVLEILNFDYRIQNSRDVSLSETHPYWELVFVDSGKLFTEVDGHIFEMNQYDCLFYSPNQSHSQHIEKNHACSCLTVIFKMSDSPVHHLNNQVFHASRNIIAVLQNFIDAADKKDAYHNDLCFCYLNEIILHLLRQQNTKTVKAACSFMQQKLEDEFLNEIIDYIHSHIYSPLTIEQLCHQFSTSRSSLQLLFNKNLMTSPKQYISQLKLKKAKYLIKENKYTITEISEKLGFASIHYFSRRFKQEFKITPSDYAKTLYK